MVVLNLSQQTDSADFLGGFQPVEPHHALLPLLDRFQVPPSLNDANCTCSEYLFGFTALIYQRCPVGQGVICWNAGPGAAHLGRRQE